MKLPGRQWFGLPRPNPLKSLNWLVTQSEVPYFSGLFTHSRRSERNQIALEYFNTGKELFIHLRINTRARIISSCSSDFAVTRKIDLASGPLSVAMLQSTTSQELKSHIERPLLLKITPLSLKQVRIKIISSVFYFS